MRVGPVQTRAVVAATQNGPRWRRGHRGRKADDHKMGRLHLFGGWQDEAVTYCQHTLYQNFRLNLAFDNFFDVYFRMNDMYACE